MKKAKFVSLTAVFCALVISAVFVMSSAAYYGDVNGDDKVNSGDARVVLRHTAKLALITDEKALILADSNKDGRVNSQDARTILRVAARLEQKVEYTEDVKPTDPDPTDPKPTTPDPTDPKPTTPDPTDPKPTTPPVTQPAPSSTIAFLPDDGDHGSVDIGDLN